MNILDVKFDDVYEVYSGRPGCGCGCLGKYYIPKPSGRADFRTVNPKMIKKVLNKFQKLEKETPGFFDVRDGNGDLPRFGCNDQGKSKIIFYHETETRYYWLYVKRSE